MSLSQSLQQKLLQKLSPQQILLMKLLQVPTANLEERIKEELEENPALEVGEDGHDDYNDDPKDEFDSSNEEDFDSDGSPDEYENLDLSEYVNDGDDEVGDYKLRDENYPGSYYKLNYNQERDALAGEYFQAVEGVTYNVAFARIK